MRLTKDEFVRAVATVDKMFQEENKMANALGVAEWKTLQFVGEYYDFLAEMCELPENKWYGTDLDYFCFELEFGRKWDTSGACDDFRTAEGLYDFITDPHYLDEFVY